MRKSFVLYTDLWQTIKHLPDEHLGQLTRLLFEYQISGATPDTSHPLFIAFGFIKATFDRDAEKWDKRADNARINGMKGGRPKETHSVNEETQKTHSVILEPTKPVSVSVSDSVNVSTSVNDSVRISFPVSIEPESAVILIEDYKPEKRKAHLFRNSKYHQNPELFREDFVNTTTFQRHPEIDPQLLFDDIKTSTDATDKYKYADWMAAAQNWCKRDVKRYVKRTFHANPADNRMAEQIARVIATPINPLTGRPWNEPDTSGGQWPDSFG